MTCSVGGLICGALNFCNNFFPANTGKIFHAQNKLAYSYLIIRKSLCEENRQVRLFRCTGRSESLNQNQVSCDRAFTYYVKQFCQDCCNQTSNSKVILRLVSFLLGYEILACVIQGYWDICKFVLWDTRYSGISGYQRLFKWENLILEYIEDYFFLSGYCLPSQPGLSIK